MPPSSHYHFFSNEKGNYSQNKNPPHIQDVQFPEIISNSGLRDLDLLKALLLKSAFELMRGHANRRYPRSN